MRISIFCLALIFLPVLNSLGQEWSLFPRGQCAFFEVSSSNGKKKIEDITCDSIFIEGEKKLLFFNTKYNIGKCYADYEYHIKRITLPGFDIETAYQQGDSVNFIYTNNQGLKFNFKFYPNAMPNDSWEIKEANLLFRCDSVSEITVLNCLDSVKYFSFTNTSSELFDNTTSFILSKHFGLIQFIPFEEVLFETPANFSLLKLIGFENDTMSEGLVTPNFDEIFHLTVGDALIWKQYYHYCAICHPDVNEPAKTTYYKDSLVSIEIATDTLTYEFVRLTKEGLSSTFKRKFNRTEYQNLFKSYASNGYFFPDVPYPEYYYDDISSLYFYRSGLTFNNDTTSLIYYSPGYLPDTIECGLVISEIGFTLEFNNYFGLTSYRYSDPSTTVIETLIGANVNNVEWGIKWEKTGWNEMNLGGILVYPNPSPDQIFLDFNQTGLQFLISDLNGNLVQKGRLVSNVINVKGMVPGIYILKVFNNSFQYTTKFVRSAN